MDSNTKTSMLKKLTLGYCPQGHTPGDIAPFDRVFEKAQNIQTDGLVGCDAVVFWGGTDIHPSFYNQGHHKTNQAGTLPSERDKFEWRAMVAAKAADIPIIGVCRGAQLMCAFDGGSLFQDVSGHNYGGHNVITNDGRTFHSTSAHHQMLNLLGVDHELLAWSSHKLSSRYENDEGAVSAPDKEPEVVYFPRLRGIAVQGHPEWQINSPFSDYINELIIEKCLN